MALLHDYFWKIGETRGGGKSVKKRKDKKCVRKLDQSVSIDEEKKGNEIDYLYKMFENEITFDSFRNVRRRLNCNRGRWKGLVRNYGNNERKIFYLFYDDEKHSILITNCVMNFVCTHFEIGYRSRVSFNTFPEVLSRSQRKEREEKFFPTKSRW